MTEHVVYVSHWDAEPTAKQMAFAASLGIEVPNGATKGNVKRLIRNEVRRLGRKALRDEPGFLDNFAVISHPGYGDCEIARIGSKTLKVTLEPLDGGRKVVIDAMQLADCELI